LIDLPQLLLSTVVVPWFELLCLAALPLASAAGVLSTPDLIVVVAAIAVGNGLLINTALLRSPAELSERQVLELVLLAPLELFVGRPVALWSRLAGLRRAAARPDALPV
jgi:hypothetical protein